MHCWRQSFKCDLAKSELISYLLLKPPPLPCIDLPPVFADLPPNCWVWTFPCCLFWKSLFRSFELKFWPPAVATWSFDSSCRTLWGCYVSGMRSLSIFGNRTWSPLSIWARILPGRSTGTGVRIVSLCCGPWTIRCRNRSSPGISACWRIVSLGYSCPAIRTISHRVRIVYRISVRWIIIYPIGSFRLLRN